jgi:hypothetical protein
MPGYRPRQGGADRAVRGSRNGDTPVMVERVVDDIDEIVRAVRFNGWQATHAGECEVVALCRARGIPARLVGGYMIYPRCPDQHYWAEFWDDARGWVPIDSVAIELSFNGRDRLWRDYFFGQLDYRMKTECLPRLFTGTPTIRFPRVWYTLFRSLETGVEIDTFDTNSGAPIFRDQIVVKRVNATPL